MDSPPRFDEGADKKKVAHGAGAKGAVPCRGKLFIRIGGPSRGILETLRLPSHRRIEPYH